MRSVHPSLSEQNPQGTFLDGKTAIGRATIAAFKINRPQMIRVRGLWIKLGEHPPNLEEESA